MSGNVSVSTKRSSSKEHERRSNSKRAGSSEDNSQKHKSGLAAVFWITPPIEMLTKGVPTTALVQDFQSYTLDDFKREVVERLSLKEWGHQLLSLTMGEDLSFLEAQSEASKNGKVAVMIKTTEVKQQEPPQEPPNAAIKTPESLQDPDKEAENRSLAYSAMVTEAREQGADRMNMNVRLWQFNMMYTLSKTEAAVQMDEVVLKLTDEEVLDQAIQYSYDLRKLNKKMSGQEEEDNEQYSSKDPTPPPTDYQPITQEEVDEYRKQTSWLDNPLYQRQDHEDACSFLGIEDPDHPRIDGLRAPFELEFYQPTAIKAMVDFENSKTHSGLLGDDPGLGKTLEMLGLLLFRSNQRRRRLEKKETVGPAKPTLVLMPAGLVTQWKDEILKFTDRFRVVVYYGTAIKTSEENVIYHKGKLNRSSEYFNTSDEKNFDTIILSTYTTWAARHGPSAQRKFHISQCEADGMRLSEAKNYVRANFNPQSADMSWDGQLQGLMQRAIIDEGHLIRHMPKNVGAAVQWLQADYRDVITGTPTLNGLDEFMGIMAFMQNPGLNDHTYLTSLGFQDVAVDNPLDDVLSRFDPWSVDDDDQRSQLKFCSQALKQYVFDSGYTAAEQGTRMMEVLSKIMIRRSFASSIGGKRIGDTLPEFQRLTIDCDYTPEERAHYEAAYMDTSNRLVRKAKDETKLMWSTTTYRRLCLMSTWLGFSYLLHYKAPFLKKFRQTNGNATTILKDLRAGQKRANIPEEKCIKVPSKEDIQSILQAHCTGSPKLRSLLGLLAEIVVLLKEKAVIWCNTPAQMEWLWCVLQLCGLDAHQLRADLKGSERDELMKDFRNKPDKTMILICSWMVSCAGINMQNNCRTIIEFEPAPSEGVRQQGIGRVRRKGATRWCRHICLRNANSFNTQQAAISLLKSLPALLTQLDLEIWGSDEDSNDEDRILGDYVKHDGRLYPANDPAVVGLELPVLDPDTLLLHIQQTLLGQELEGDIVSLREATKPKRYSEVAGRLEPLWV